MFRFEQSSYWRIPARPQLAIIVTGVLSALVLCPSSVYATQLGSLSNNPNGYFTTGTCTAP